MTVGERAMTFGRGVAAGATSIGFGSVGFMLIGMAHTLGKMRGGVPGTADLGDRGRGDGEREE